jgi:hypothetical protein
MNNIPSDVANFKLYISPMLSSHPFVRSRIFANHRTATFHQPYPDTHLPQVKPHLNNKILTNHAQPRRPLTKLHLAQNPQTMDTQPPLPPDPHSSLNPPSHPSSKLHHCRKCRREMYILFAEHHVSLCSRCGRPLRLGALFGKRWDVKGL